MEKKKPSLERWSKSLSIIASVLLLAFLLVAGLFNRVDVFSLYGLHRDLERPVASYEEVADPDAPIGVTRVYSFTVARHLEYDCYLGFYSSHHLVRVTVGDEVVYKVGIGENNVIEGTVGGDWVMVPVSHKNEGETVRIELSPLYENVRDQKVELLLGERISISRYQIVLDLPQLVLSVLAIILGLFFLLFSFISFPRGRDANKLSCLGYFSLVLGVWRLMDNRSVSLFATGELNELVYMLIFATMMLSFLPIIRFFYDRQKWRSALIYDGYLILSSCIIISAVMLQAWGIFDLREMFFLPYICLFGGAIVIFGVGLFERFITHTSNKSFLYFGFEFICCGGALLDMTLYYTQSSSTNLNVTLVCFIFYIFVAGIYLVAEYNERERRLKENEKQLADARASVMLSQIQPHFLFNTLTSIAGLCEIDPKMARKVTLDFSTYLRGNLGSLTNRGLISFDQELEHTRCYLNIEAARFGDRIRVEYDINYTAFFLPPLTLQPLVENAVRHGITTREEGGCVRISTYLDGDYIYLIVADDGVGYKFNELYGSADGSGAHVGLSNVRERLESMLAATLDVHSAEGAGTTVTIKIPNSERGKLL